ncbi:MAG: AEC family transporter [Candidatus Anstonellales archaeon]
MLELIFLLFIGYAIKNHIDAKTIFNILFYLVIPSAIILQFSDIRITPDLALFPLLYIISGLLIIHVIEFLGKRSGFNRVQIGTGIITVPIINAGALYSISYYFFGAEGLVKSTLYTIGYIFLIPYSIFRASNYSVHYSNREDLIIGQTIKSPIIISMIIAILMNYLDIKIEGVFRDMMDRIVDMLVPLSMMSIGATINLSTTVNRFILSILAIRAILPVLIIILLYNLHLIEYNDLKLLIIATLSPLGFFGPMISNRIGLDVELSSNLVFVSIILFLIIFIWI